MPFSFNGELRELGVETLICSITVSCECENGVSHHLYFMVHLNSVPNRVVPKALIALQQVQPLLTA
eukprot:4389776-Amphidinium_carterae.1